jgi:hypothetical protein
MAGAEKARKPNAASWMAPLGRDFAYWKPEARNALSDRSSFSDASSTDSSDDDSALRDDVHNGSDHATWSEKEEVTEASLDERGVPTSIEYFRQSQKSKEWEHIYKLKQPLSLHDSGRPRKTHLCLLCLEKEPRPPSYTCALLSLTTGHYRSQLAAGTTQGHVYLSIYISIDRASIGHHHRTNYLNIHSAFFFELD